MPSQSQPSGSSIEQLARCLGFDLAGVAPLEPTPESAFLREWLDRGYGGEMHYLERRAAERMDPRRVMPEARSAIVVGVVYDGEEAGGEGVPIARYARGDDYHEVLLDRLRALHAGIEALLGRAVAARPYVDTGPIAERVLAAYAGLGWLGKNTLLIHPRLGSYVFLGVLLCDLELAPGEREPDHCGSCRACLDACPTDAFVAPYVLDATRCIAYTTIEDPGAIPEPLRDAHADHVFGCDVCQEVCPWNQRPRRESPPDPLGLRARLAARPQWQAPTLAWLLGLDQEAWRAVTRHSALRRARWRGLLRNALVAAGNSGDSGLKPLLERHARGADALLAEHAIWALGRLEARDG